MAWLPFKIIPKRFLGIDVGTSAIKIVELLRFGDRVKLENYGEIKTRSLYERAAMSFEKNNFLFSSRDIAEAIVAILETAKIEAKDAIFSIPDFSTFFTFLKLPPMTKEEIPSAVQFKARQHVPLPLTEVVLDWSIVGNSFDKKKQKDIDILLVAVPQEVINQYQEIAKFSQLRLLSLEAEVFGLIRALIKDKKGGIICIVDFGAQSTTISIAAAGVLKITHSFDVSGNELTRLLSNSLNIGYNEAEELKREYGVKSLDTQVGRVLSPMIDLLLVEIEKISRNFYQNEGKEVEKIILAGSSMLIPGLKDYSFDWLKKPVEIANPFTGIVYPPALEPVLKEMGPSYSIAVGVALRGFEK